MSPEIKPPGRGSSPRKATIPIACKQAGEPKPRGLAAMAPIVGRGDLQSSLCVPKATPNGKVGSRRDRREPFRIALLTGWWGSSVRPAVLVLLSGGKLGPPIFLPRADSIS
jgi:hypothetical protein